MSLGNVFIYSTFVIEGVERRKANNVQNSRGFIGGELDDGEPQN
jgi:hypothetical protein